MTDWLDGIDTRLLRKYDKPGPRYTSYPTAPVWRESFGERDYRDRLRRAETESPQLPLSVYVHIPFCRERCTFCGCNVIVTRDQTKADRYLDALAAEMDLVLREMPTRRDMIQLHLGGGTPTFLDPAQLERLQREITRRFHILEGAELSIEIDPGVTTPEQIRLLRRLGYNRISIGVQDFDHEILSALNRPQTVADIRRLYDTCRQAGFGGINLDLIYGLPRQTAERFRRTREIVLEMRPDRLAVYSYAHVPWIKGHQRKIDETTLPDVETKFTIYLETIRHFLGAGYEQIGMDHFAVPDDELARARRAGTLQRNFMGYTTRAAEDMLAFGVSSISHVRNCFAQNTPALKRYSAAIASGRLPVSRGYALDADDLVRADIIRDIMCNFEIDLRSLQEKHGIDFRRDFAPELEELARTIDADFCGITNGKFVVHPKGRLFVRNICMVFDRYLGKAPERKPVFSRTI